ncbi:hypothetical protein BMWSH_4438 [Priestia megaterium WSH-002]|uniref:Uncharacterized protein n=1 Tax=Priestia megaterium (strain WSH-002) TaxID=1006007 RepID=A0A8D4BM49_PRIMW|nr:hypothetical protein BMWSH_4438 [Priestia megaterium WSH-002]
MNEPILAYFDKFSFTKNSLIYLQKTKKRRKILLFFVYRI